MTQDTCDCEQWKKSQLDGTDSEGYGQLVRSIHGKWNIGAGLPEPTFCPWCGKPVIKAPLCTCVDCTAERALALSS
jgi:hypothetical protein